LIDTTTRTTLESLLVDNFSTVTLQVPPALTGTLSLDCTVKYLTQDILDEIIDEEENLVVIGVSYPVMDRRFIRNVSDRFQQLKQHNLLSEAPAAAGDWITVNGAVTASFSFNVAEPNISRIGIYTKTVAGTTSWLWFEMYNERGLMISRRLIFTTNIIETGWLYLDFNMRPRINPTTGFSETFTVILREETYGATPTGIDIGKTGVAIAYRIYTYRYAELVGKLNTGTMRINVYAKDKKTTKDPSPLLFIGKDDIVGQVIKQIREYVWSNWTQYGLNDIDSTVLTDGETSSDIIPYGSGVMDITLVVPDFGIVPTPVATIKQITIEHEEE